MLEIARELVRPVATRRGGDPFGEPGQRVEQRQLIRVGGRPLRARQIRVGGGCPAHPRRGAGVRVPHSIGGVTRVMARDFLRVDVRGLARQEPGQGKPYGIPPGEGDRRRRSPPSFPRTDRPVSLWLAYSPVFGSAGRFGEPGGQLGGQPFSRFFPGDSR
jgi:hypothetical protein